MGSMLTAGLLLSGCNSDSIVNATATANAGVEEKVKPSYIVSLKNLTYAQPMAPIAVAYHSQNTSLFEIGKSASLGLEKLAESGDNSTVLLELSNNILVKVTQGGTGLILPSKSDTITLEGDATECISVTAMLVNTNDAFTGVNCVDVSKMANGEVLTLELPTYDAGTEANSETAGTIPGPAGGGEGFNEARDDRDFVTVHSGVVTKDDGLSSSALTQDHTWDNPTAMLRIERIK